MLQSNKREKTHNVPPLLDQLSVQWPFPESAAKKEQRWETLKTVKIKSNTQMQWILVNRITWDRAFFSFASEPEASSDT